MDPIRLTIAVPTRNRRETVLGALEAVVGQLRATDDLIVVDNGSTDGTHEAVAALLAERFPTGRVVSEPEGGVSAARNAALREASTEVVCFLDDDIRPAPEWVNHMRHAWSTCSPRTAAIGGPTEADWLAERPSWLTDHLLYVLAILDLGDQPHRLDQRPGRGYIWGGNMSLRVKAALEVGGFDAGRGTRPDARYERGEEEDVQRRLAEAGWEVWYEPSVVVRHLVPRERLTKPFFVKFFRGQGLLDAARGRPRREGAVALVGALARRVAFAVLRRPHAAGARFASVQAWAALTGPRRPKARQEA